MTEGIIQKVFAKYMPEPDEEGFDLLFIVRQELIAEIEKEINEDKINGFLAQHEMVLSKSEILTKLIGDNQ